MLLDAQVLTVPLSCEVIAIIDEAYARMNPDLIARDQVFGTIVFFFFQGHSWIVREDRLLGELVAVEEQWERVLARVLLSDLLDLDGIISQEEVQDEVVDGTLYSLVVPEHLEAEDLPVVGDILLKACVGVSSS